MAAAEGIGVMSDGDRDGREATAAQGAHVHDVVDFDAVAVPGREREHRILQDGLCDDHASIIVVVGPPGVGKSHLARVALDIAKDAGRPTRWATGTTTAATIPMGAMAHLIPSAPGGGDPFTLLQRAMSELAGDHRGRTPVVVIDDEHLLDELSVTLVEHLARSRSVAIVLTMCSGGPISDPLPAQSSLSALWKNGSATRLELEPLAHEDANRLVAESLGGAVDTRTGARLWQLSRGNPLFLRELVEGGRAAGHLRRHDGMWRWQGDMDVTPRLVEIVLTQLGRLDPDLRSTLEVLAIGEPVGLDRLVELCPRGAVAELERRGVVQVIRAGHLAQARMTHPMYSEVIRGRMPEAEAERIRRQLAHRLGQRPSHDDLLRTSRILLDSEEDPLDVDLLTDAACHANTLLDHALAERFAHAAVSGGAGIRAHLARLEAVQWQGRVEHAEELAAVAEHLATTDWDRSRLGMMRALNLFFGVGRAGEAEAAITAAADRVTDADALNALRATSALTAFLAGRVDRAIELGTSVLSRAGTSSCARPLAAAAIGSALAVTGRTADARRVTADGWAALEQLPNEISAPFVRLALTQAELLALWLTGRLRELEARAAGLHQRSMAAPECAGDAVAALHMGWAAVRTGRLGSATRWLTEAMAGLNRWDPGGLMPLCSAQLAQTRAQLGDAAGARELIGDLDTSRGAMRVFEPQLLLAHAWVATAESRHPEAADLVIRAAAVAAEGGQSAIEAMILHTAVQFGRAADVAERLRELTGLLTGPLFAACAAHADAAVAGSGPGLDKVAAAFEKLGAMLPAADAAAQAAVAHQVAGDRRRASISTATATRLARACDGARTPALTRVALPSLTVRELEVARLAAEGLNNQDIADRLVLSVRTVEAHLAHSYTKLGITSRTQLGEAIEATVDLPAEERHVGGADQRPLAS